MQRLLPQNNNLELTPEITRYLEEDAFQKNTPKFKKQCEPLEKQIWKYLVKQIKKGIKDPYNVYIGSRKKSLSDEDVLRIIHESLVNIEKKWYIGIKLIDIKTYAQDISIHLTNFFTNPDQCIFITISENPIEGTYHYISNKTIDRCHCPDDTKCQRCRICDDNHVNCVVYPCGHANFCKDCVQKIEKCSVCRGEIFEVKHIFI